MSESFILQTYPFREADLVVSFFTRDQGKLRGVARRARRPKSSFGSGLERLSHATVSYYQKENRELVSLNSCELMQSQFRWRQTTNRASRSIIWRKSPSSCCLPTKPTSATFAC
jgi:DNA repair protein RecO